MGKSMSHVTLFFGIALHWVLVDFSGDQDADEVLAVFVLELPLDVHTHFRVRFEDGQRRFIVRFFASLKRWSKN